MNKFVVNGSFIQNAHINTYKLYKNKTIMGFHSECFKFELALIPRMF